jgi:hypothetical protein
MDNNTLKTNWYFSIHDLKFTYSILANNNMQCYVYHIVF